MDMAREILKIIFEYANVDKDTPRSTGALSVGPTVGEWYFEQCLLQAYLRGFLAGEQSILGGRFLDSCCLRLPLDSWRLRLAGPTLQLMGLDLVAFPKGRHDVGRGGYSHLIKLRLCKT